MPFGISMQNIYYIGGGILLYMFSNKLGPVKGIAKFGGLALAGLGVADQLGFLDINQLKSSVGLYGAWERQTGAYAVDVRNMPYDPNNYYLPPRDVSIAP